MNDERTAGTTPCTCGGGDPMGFAANSLECCLTCGGWLDTAANRQKLAPDPIDTAIELISSPAKMITGE